MRGAGRVVFAAVLLLIVGLVARQGAVLAATGVAAGLAVALGAGQALQALLVGVSPRDGWTFSAAVAVAFLMALLGCLRPTLRAVSVDPLTVMRAD